MASRYLTSLRVYTGIKISCLFLLVLFFSSCEKTVNINLSTSSAQLVVEGQIETGLPPAVMLTNSIGFFSAIDLSTIQNSFVHNAVVKVSDGSQTITLHEYSLDTGANSKFYIYSIDSSNFMLGQVGKYYTLSVTYNGKTYTGTTKIPNPKPVDSMWTAPPTFTNAKTPPGLVQLFVNYTDPDTLGNYVRYYTKRNHQPFYPGNNVFTDAVINGQRVPDIALSLGYNDTGNPNANYDSLRYLVPGDTVILKWSMIDKGVYTFWNTYSFAERAVGNPFSSPINVQSNMSNGALGLWAGYGTSFDTLVAK